MLNDPDQATEIFQHTESLWPLRRSLSLEEAIVDLNAFCSATVICRCKGELQAHVGLNFRLHFVEKAAFFFGWGEKVTAQTPSV